MFPPHFRRPFLMTQQHRSHAWLALLIAAATALYWGGLSGPFVLDDRWNLTTIELWQAGEQPWQLSLFPFNHPLLLTRPVSMASFMLSAWLGGGVEAFPFKLGNLVTHLLCGVLGWWLLRRLLRLDPRLAPRADVWALVAIAIWLLHPLQVSTVLYVVQRMAQLATLFTLAAVAVYLVARQRLQQDRPSVARWLLFGLFPLLFVLGLLSKQNAAIAGFLCLVLELAYFRRPERGRNDLRAFFGVFVALPVLATLALLALRPQTLLAGYADWDFTLGQRLLTQPRALLDYIGMWFVPRGPRMGLYTDAYPVSTGLLSPPSTVLAILVLMAITGLAIVMRKRAPSVFAGWFFFLVAHAVESTFLPLEMYYEHRNYLPSLGLLLMAIGLVDAVARRFGQIDLLGQRLAMPILVAFAAVLAFSTFSQASLWKTMDGILTNALAQQPVSHRAHMDAALLTLSRQNFSAARRLNQTLTQSEDPAMERTGHFLSVLTDCVEMRSSVREDLEAAERSMASRLNLFDLHVLRALETVTRQGDCGEVSSGDIARTFSHMADISAQANDGSDLEMMTRHYAARLHARAGDWTSAAQQSHEVWQRYGYLPSGTLLAKAYLRLDRTEEAASLLDSLQQAHASSDGSGSEELSQLRADVISASERRRPSH